MDPLPHKAQPLGRVCSRRKTPAAWGRRTRTQTVTNSTPRNHLLGSATIHVSLIEDDVRSHVCWPGRKHLLLAINQIAGAERSQLKPMPVRNRVRRTSLYAIAAENAPVVVDVVYLRVALCSAHAVFRRIIGGFDVDAI